MSTGEGRHALSAEQLFEISMVKKTQMQNVYKLCAAGSICQFSTLTLHSVLHAC